METTVTSSERPKIKPGFSFVAVDDETAVVTSAERTLRMRGEAPVYLMSQVVPLLDGRRTVEEICGVLGHIEPPLIHKVLGQLAEHRLLEPHDRDGDGAFSAFVAVTTNNWLRAEPGPSLADARVAIVAESSAGAATLAGRYRRSLAELGIGEVTESGGEQRDSWADVVAGQDLVMFIADKPLVAVRQEVHAACLAAKVKLSCAEFLSASVIALGPTVVPGQTACWTCLDRRQRGTQEHYPEHAAIKDFLLHHPEVDPVGSRLPALADVLAGLAAFETVRILTNVYPAVTYGSLATFNCVELRVDHHPVLKLPRCPDCSPVRDKPPPRTWSW